MPFLLLGNDAYPRDSVSHSRYHENNDGEQGLSEEVASVVSDGIGQGGHSLGCVRFEENNSREHGEDEAPDDGGTITHDETIFFFFLKAADAQRPIGEDIVNQCLRQADDIRVEQHIQEAIGDADNESDRGTIHIA